jgi:hypothetical protein
MTGLKLARLVDECLRTIPKELAPAKAGVADFSDKIMRKKRIGEVGAIERHLEEGPQQRRFYGAVAARVWHHRCCVQANRMNAP